MIWSRSRTLPWLSPWINNLELSWEQKIVAYFQDVTHFKLLSLRNHWESFRACCVYNLKNICSIDLSGERARSRWFTRTCYDHPLNSFLLVTVVSGQCFCSLLLVLLNSTCNLCTTISTSSTRFLFCVCVCGIAYIFFSKHVNLGQDHAIEWP